MLLTRERIQQFSEQQQEQQQSKRGTQSEYELSECRSEYSLMSHVTLQQFTSHEAKQKAKILNKKYLYKKLEEFHKHTFHSLLQAKNKQCQICHSNSCKMGVTLKLPTFQMMFANVFSKSKIVLRRSTKKEEQFKKNFHTEGEKEVNQDGK